LNFKKILIIVFVSTFFSLKIFSIQTDNIDNVNDSGENKTLIAEVKKPLFLYTFTSFNLANFGGHYDVAALLGLRVSYFFLNPLSKINIGIIGQISYLMFGEEYAKANYIESGILCSIKLKFSSVSNINLNIGLSLLNRTNYDFDPFSNEFYNTVPAFAFEIGYLFITSNQKFTFFFNFSSLYAILYKEYDYGSTFSQKKPGFMYGVCLGIGFNLL
jgi:hypothetical protein